MKLRLLLILFLLSAQALIAQNLNLFYLTRYDTKANGAVTFVSLSDIYPISDNADSLAMPPFKEGESNVYVRLEGKYRKTFLSRTKISETDKVFIYDYAQDVLISFTVKNLKTLACMSFYGPESGYMIGFEIDKKFLSGFGKYFNNVFVYVGKENPFVQGQLKRVTWKKLPAKDFPSLSMSEEDSILIRSHTGNPIKSETYIYKANGLVFYVQDYLWEKENSVAVKRLLIMDQKTNTLKCERILMDGESASFAPLDNQWTGKLFKNKPGVIFGFMYESFGCPSIIIIDKSKTDIYTKCDNRH